MATATKEYEFKIVIPGKRWKITHNTPGQKCIQSTYFVALNERERKLDCSCPASRFNPSKPCKHIKHTANIIGKPELSWFGEDALPF